MNWKTRKKKKKLELEVIEEKEEDPLEVLGRDLMMKIMEYVDARSVALCLLVSRTWYFLASSDRLWTSKCEELWQQKAHIPRLSQIRGLSKLEAYSVSIMEGKRTWITKDDLCDHHWEVHFTSAAPEYWRDLDPYWTGSGPLMHRYFHPDGSHTADPDDKVWGGHECCFSVVTTMFYDGRVRDNYVKVNNWLQLSVHRKEDWSWDLYNTIYVYSSVPDANKEGGTGPLYL